MNHELYAAISDGDIDAVRGLLDAGADVNEVDKEAPSGMSPLCLSVLAGYPPVTKLLLDAGADINARDRDGWTPLHYGVIHNEVDAVQILLTAGADTAIQNNNGRTPLQCAISHHVHPEIVHMLGGVYETGVR